MPLTYIDGQNIYHHERRDGKTDLVHYLRRDEKVVPVSLPELDGHARLLEIKEVNQVGKVTDNNAVLVCEWPARYTWESEPD